MWKWIADFAFAPGRLGTNAGHNKPLTWEQREIMSQRSRDIASQARYPLALHAGQCAHRTPTNDRSLRADIYALARRATCSTITDSRGEPIRPAGIRQHLHPVDEPPPPTCCEKRLAALDGGAAGLACAQRTRGRHRSPVTIVHSGQNFISSRVCTVARGPVQSDLCKTRHRGAFLRSAPPGKHREFDRREHPRGLRGERRATIRRTTCPTSEDHDSGTPSWVAGHHRQHRADAGVCSDRSSTVSIAWS